MSRLAVRPDTHVKEREQGPRRGRRTATACRDHGARYGRPKGDGASLWKHGGTIVIGVKLKSGWRCQLSWRAFSSLSHVLSLFQTYQGGCSFCTSRDRLACQPEIKRVPSRAPLLTCLRLPQNHRCNSFACRLCVSYPGARGLRLRTWGWPDTPSRSRSGGLPPWCSTTELSGAATGCPEISWTRGGKARQGGGHISNKKSRRDSSCFVFWWPRGHRGPRQLPRA